MADIKQVADAADMIVNGYAFTRCTEGYRVLNLNRPDRAAVFSKDGKVLETSMDDIEVRIAGDYLYFTSYCVIECMHVHASDRKLTEAGSAKFFVKDNGDTVLQNRGILNDREIRKIQEFIKQNYQEMYLNNCASHSRYFSDELDAQIFCQKKEQMFTPGTICAKI